MNWIFISQWSLPLTFQTSTTQNESIWLWLRCKNGLRKQFAYFSLIVYLWNVPINYKFSPLLAHSIYLCSFFHLDAISSVTNFSFLYKSCTFNIETDSSNERSSVSGIYIERENKCLKQKMSNSLKLNIDNRWVCHYECYECGRNLGIVLNTKYNVTRECPVCRVQSHPYIQVRMTLFIHSIFRIFKTNV